MKTVIIYDSNEPAKEPMDENTIHIPIPDFMKREQKATTTALRTAREMGADRIVIYRGGKT